MGSFIYYVCAGLGGWVQKRTVEAVLESVNSDNSIKNTALRPNWQYKASTAEMAENRYS